MRSFSGCRLLSSRSAAFAAALSIAFGSHAAAAQVNEAERATARGLFHEGDDLQRAGRFAEALEKFERAQQVYAAPTNELRIAECQAALGHLVESAEAFRAVVRTPLGPSSPPAFQAAVDQARAELEQVEPRVPKIIVQPVPAHAAHLELAIDGQSVPAALVGVPVPLDPGPHKIALSAPGTARTEESILLAERETRTLAMALHPAAGGVAAGPNLPPLPPASVPPGPPPPPLPGPPPPPSAATLAPPPPALVYAETDAPKRSRTGLLLGAHLGGEGLGGQIPQNGQTVDASTIAAGGVAYGIDVGFRFAQNIYLGATLEHATFGAGTQIGTTGVNATQLGAVLGLIVNPNRTSFYGEVGFASRWFAYDSDMLTGASSPRFTAGELSLGAGVWIPIGRFFRLVPKGTLGLGTFDDPNDSSTHAAHVFVALAVAGFYNLDL